MNQLQLGDRAKDTITGFKGIVVAVTDWLHGCRRITIQPEHLVDGRSAETATFDEPQCALVKRCVFYRTAATGGPRPEPTRQPQPSR